MLKGVGGEGREGGREKPCVVVLRREEGDEPQQVLGGVCMFHYIIHQHIDHNDCITYIQLNNFIHTVALLQTSSGKRDHAYITSQLLYYAYTLLIPHI